MKNAKNFTKHHDFKWKQHNSPQRGNFLSILTEKNYYFWEKAIILWQKVVILL